MSENGDYSPLASTVVTAPQGDLAETKIGAGVPSITSTAQSLPAEATDTAEDEKAFQRESQGSIKAPSRKGSVASSKKGNTIAATVGGQPKELEGVSGTGSGKAKKQGVSRFLSFLNCCGGSKNANDVELDEAVPAKKAKTSQANRNRQTTPMTKPNASAGESSTAESKEAVEENIGGPPYSELTPAAKPKMGEAPKRDIDMTEKPIKTPDIMKSPDSKNSTGQPMTHEQPLPPVPEPEGTTVVPGAATENPSLTSTDGYADPALTTPPINSQDITQTETMAIDDRIPQPKHEDVEMADAPPEAPLQQEQPAGQGGKEQNQLPIPLPPPPPRSAQDRPFPSDRRASNGATPSDQQKWLLPPIAPSFRGKKCLVLDLDETLVHSSFKVRLHLSLQHSYCSDPCRFSIKRTLRYLLKSRANFIMSM